MLWKGYKTEWYVSLFLYDDDDDDDDDDKSHSVFVFLSLSCHITTVTATSTITTTLNTKNKQKIIFKKSIFITCVLLISTEIFTLKFLILTCCKQCK